MPDTLVVRAVVDEQPQIDADLVRRETGSVGRVHRQEHVVDERGEIGPELGHVPARLVQDLLADLGDPSHRPAPGVGREPGIRRDGPALYEHTRHECFSCSVWMVWAVGIGVPPSGAPPYPPLLMTTEHAQRPQGQTGHTRRRFLAGAGGAAGALALWPATGASAASGKHVAVLGGGVAGLTAAHELAERGFAVTVYERRARRQGPQHGRTGQREGRPQAAPRRARLPLHPRHLPQPAGHHAPHPLPRERERRPGQPRWRHARCRSRAAARPSGHADPAAPRDPPPAPGDLTPGDPRDPRRPDPAFNLPAHEAAYFVEPRPGLPHQLRRTPRRTTGSRRPGGSSSGRGGCPRTTSASSPSASPATSWRPRRRRPAPARSATLGEAFAFNVLGRGADGPPDRILNAPTNEAWIDPWVTHLKLPGRRVPHRLDRPRAGLRRRPRHRGRRGGPGRRTA